MRVTDRTGQRVSGICLWRDGQAKQARYHHLYLFFIGRTMADYRLFDLAGGIFADREILVHQSRDRCAACLAEL